MAPYDQPVPSDCGRRLLPHVIDMYAREQPDRPWASLAVDDYDLAKGYEDISYLQFAQAIDKMAWFIEKHVGKSETFETIAYLGAADVRYHMIEMAVCKTGHKVLFSSLLNSAQVHLSLMEQTQCKILLSANGIVVQDLLREDPDVKHFVVPELDALLGSEDGVVPAYPYTKTFDEAKYDPYVVLHTSGTTGNPKAVLVNHALPAAMDAQRLLPDVEGRKHYLEFVTYGDGVRALVPTSPFHVASAVWSFSAIVFGGGVMVTGFRHRTPHPADILPILDHARIKKAFLTPWILEDIARRDDVEKYAAPLDSVVYGTAVLSPYAVDVWSRYTRIQNVWGMTESLGPPHLEQDAGDDAYITLDMVHSGIRFRDARTTEVIDGRVAPLYELEFTLTPESARYGGVGTAMVHARMGVPVDAAGKADTPVYGTGDLWTPHPDPAKAAYVWRFAGRVDDVITFKTGVNTHPGPLERALTADALVRSALVTGNGHVQPLALVELAEGVEADSEGARALWGAAVEPVNAMMQAHGRVAESHLVVLPCGSFVRTPKGSVSRRQTVERFKDRIDDVYRTHGDHWQDNSERFGRISRQVSVQISDEGAEPDGAA